MGNPLYQVGEEVILNSVNNPEYNGEYFIVKVVKKGDMYICRLTGHNVYPDGKYGLYSYILNVPHPHPKENCEINWAERSLRKKHKPSEFGSYEQLMKNLSSPVKQTS